MTLNGSKQSKRCCNAQVPEKHDPENTELGTALDELILWDMPAEDKSEYKDITDLIAEKKLASSGWTLAERQLHAKQKAKEKDAKKKKAKTKAKPKGRPMGKVERKPHGGFPSSMRQASERCEKESQSAWANSKQFFGVDLSIIILAMGPP